VPEIFDTVTIDPKVGNNTEMMLKTLFKKEYNFNNVVKSQLYTIHDDVKIEL